MSVPISQVDLVGTTFAEQYEILALLGCGGMGEVYKARHKLLDQVVAVKVLQKHLCSSQDSLERISQEGRAAPFLDHPNIVKIRHLGITDEGRPFLVMDYLEGSTLSEILERVGRLDVKRFHSIFAQCLDALAHAHRSGIVHRDLKPANIMVGPGDRTKVLDFGLAKILPTEGVPAAKAPLALTQAGALVGSPCYMSPEQCLGQVPDCRSDIYSLGCVMYEALTGKQAFCGATPLDTMYRHINSPTPDPARDVPEISLSPSLCQLILQCLEKNPHDRFQSAGQLKAALEAIAGSAQESPEQSPSPRGRQEGKLLPMAPLTCKRTILVTVVFLAILTSGSIVYQSLTQSSAPPGDTVSGSSLSQLEPQSAHAANQLAGAALARKLEKEARLLFGRALTLSEKAGDIPEQITAHCGLSDCSGLSAEQRRLHCLRSLELSEKFFGSASYEHSNTLLHYSSWLDSSNMYSQAMANMEKVLAIREKYAVGVNHMSLAGVTFGLGNSYLKQKQYGKAERYFKRTIEIYEQANVSDWREVLDAINGLAVSLMAQHKVAQALPLFERYVEALLKRSDTTPTIAATAIFQLADCYGQNGKDSQAAQRYEEALKIVSDNPNIKIKHLKQILLAYADNLKRLHRWAQAGAAEVRASLVLEDLE